MYFLMISRTKYTKNVLVGNPAVLVRNEIHCNKHPGTRRVMSVGYPGSKINTRFNPNMYVCGWVKTNPYETVVLERICKRWILHPMVITFFEQQYSTNRTKSLSLVEKKGSQLGRTTKKVPHFATEKIKMHAQYSYIEIHRHSYRTFVVYHKGRDDTQYYFSCTSTNINPKISSTTIPTLE